MIKALSVTDSHDVMIHTTQRCRSVVFDCTENASLCHSVLYKTVSYVGNNVFVNITKFNFILLLLYRIEYETSQT